MVRHLALFGEKPYKSCLINGMVLGNDGRKMSKSLGNYIATPEVYSKYGDDATRQWAAAGCATGSDIPFRWPDVEYGWRFLIKLWNAARFASLSLKDYKPSENVQLQLLDRWILSRLERATKKVSEALENCQFNIAMEDVRNFTWHELCDLYNEAVKDRLYKPEVYGEEKKNAAQYTLYTSIYRIIQLLAPISPHITEEIYQAIYKEDMKHPSIHISPWPIPNEKRISEETEKYGDIVISFIVEIRGDKAEKKKPLNAPIKKLTIYAENRETANILEQAKDDIMGSCKITSIKISAEKGDGKAVEKYPHVRYTVEY